MTSHFLNSKDFSPSITEYYSAIFARISLITLPSSSPNFHENNYSQTMWIRSRQQSFPFDLYMGYFLTSFHDRDISFDSVINPWNTSKLSRDQRSYQK